MTSRRALLALALAAGCRFAAPEQDTDPFDCAPEDEIPYDGVDQDCDHRDLTDVDEDGFDAVAAGGDDCDDEDAAVFPEADEVAYDGVDQDCDGADLTDVDGDGHDAVAAGGDDCDDEDRAAYPGGRERPYDGVDQDCDGADLTDADGDGFDATEAGGDDCTDTDPTVYPGAAERAYDGVDQDCDGADLTDVDGDGFDAERAGGTDCADDDPTRYPGAGEDRANGVDDDCDGVADEVHACGDGTGDATSVQAAADLAPTGGTVQLCPGTYPEALVLTNRNLRFAGTGATPEEVVLVGPSGGTTVTLTGSSSDIGFQDLSIQPGDLALEARNVRNLYLERVSFVAGSPSRIRIDLGTTGGSTRTEAVVDGCAFGDATLEIVGRTRGDLAFTRNLVAAEAGFELSVSSLADHTLQVANNLVVGTFGLSLSNQDGTLLDTEILHNTFADAGDGGTLATTVCQGTPCTATLSMPQVTVASNIFAWIAAGDDEAALWLVDWQDTAPFAEFDPATAAPVSFCANLLWDLDLPTAQVTYARVEARGDTPLVDLDGTLSVELEAMSILEDPQFLARGGMGSYALSSTSPALDAGCSGLDPDGSPADVGAFGGPDGDWWMDSAFPLP